jgi:hypothetical protein
MNPIVRLKDPRWSSTYQYGLIIEAVARDHPGWEIADTYWIGGGAPMRVTLRNTRQGNVEFFQINLETLKLDQVK